MGLDIVDQIKQAVSGGYDSSSGSDDYAPSVSVGKDSGKGRVDKTGGNSSNRNNPLISGGLHSDVSQQYSSRDNSAYWSGEREERHNVNPLYSSASNANQNYQDALNARNNYIAQNSGYVDNDYARYEYEQGLAKYDQRVADTERTMNMFTPSNQSYAPTYKTTDELNGTSSGDTFQLNPPIMSGNDPTAPSGGVYGTPRLYNPNQPAYQNPDDGGILQKSRASKYLADPNISEEDLKSSLMKPVNWLVDTAKNAWNGFVDGLTPTHVDVDSDTKRDYANRLIDYIEQGYGTDDIKKAAAGDSAFLDWLDFIKPFEASGNSKAAMTKTFDDIVAYDMKTGANALGYKSIGDAREGYQRNKDKNKDYDKVESVERMKTEDPEMYAKYSKMNPAQQAIYRVLQSAKGGLAGLGNAMLNFVGKAGSEVSKAAENVMFSLDTTPAQSAVYIIANGGLPKNGILQNGQVSEFTQEQWDNMAPSDKARLEKFYGIDSLAEFNKTLRELNYNIGVSSTFNEYYEGKRDEVVEATKPIREYANVKAYEASYGLNGVAKLGVELVPSAIGMMFDSVVGGLPAMGMRVFGDAYSRAIDKGVDDQRATLYALASTAVEVGTELIGGESVVNAAVYKNKGIFNSGAEAIIGSIDNTTMQRIALAAIGGLEEGLEEDMSQLCEPLVEALLETDFFQAVKDGYGEQRAADYAWAALGGALMSIAGAPVTDVITSISNRAAEAKGNFTPMNIDGTTRESNPNGRAAYSQSSLQIAQINQNKAVAGNPLAMAAYEQSIKSGASEDEARSAATYVHDSTSTLTPEQKKTYANDQDKFNADVDAFQEHRDEFKNAEVGDVVLDINNNEVGTVTKADDNGITVELANADGEKTTEEVKFVGNNGVLDADSNLAKALGKEGEGAIVNAEEAKIFAQEAAAKRKAQEEAKAAAANTPQQTTDSGTGTVAQQKPTVGERSTTGEAKAEAQTPQASKAAAPKTVYTSEDGKYSIVNNGNGYSVIDSNGNTIGTSQGYSQAVEMIRQRNAATTVGEQKTSGEERAEEQAPPAPKAAAATPTNPLVQEERSTTGEDRAEQQEPEAPKSPAQQFFDEHPQKGRVYTSDYKGATVKIKNNGDGTYTVSMASPLKNGTGFTKAAKPLGTVSSIDEANQLVVDEYNKRNHAHKAFSDAVGTTSEIAPESPTIASDETGNSVPTQAQESTDTANETLNTGSESDDIKLRKSGYTIQASKNDPTLSMEVDDTTGKRTSAPKATVPAETIEKALYGEADVGAARYEGTLNEKQVAKLSATQVIQRLQNYARKAGTSIKGLLKHIASQESGEPLVSNQSHTKQLVDSAVSGTLGQNVNGEYEDEVDVVGGEDDTRKERPKQSVEEAQEEANEINRSNLMTLGDTVRNAMKNPNRSKYRSGLAGVCDLILEKGKDGDTITKEMQNSFFAVVQKILDDEYHRQHGYDKDINWKKFTIADALKLIDNALAEKADLDNLTDEDFTEINALLNRADNIDVGYGEYEKALGDKYMGRISLSDVLSGDERYRDQLPDSEIYDETNLTAGEKWIKDENGNEVKVSNEEGWRENSKEEDRRFGWYDRSDATEGMDDQQREEYEDSYWAKNGARDVANMFNQKSNTGTGNGIVEEILPDRISRRYNPQTHQWEDILDENGNPTSIPNPRLSGTVDSRRTIQSYNSKSGKNFIIQVGNGMFRHFLDTGMSPKIKATIDQHKQNVKTLQKRIENGILQRSQLSPALGDRIKKWDAKIAKLENQLALEEAWLEKVEKGWDRDGNGKIASYTLTDFLNDKTKDANGKDFITKAEKDSIRELATFYIDRYGATVANYGGYKLKGLANAKSRDFARDIIDEIVKGVENGELAEHGYFPRTETDRSANGQGLVVTERSVYDGEYGYDSTAEQRLQTANRNIRNADTGTESRVGQNNEGIPGEGAGNLGWVGTGGGRGNSLLSGNNQVRSADESALSNNETNVEVQSFEEVNQRKYTNLSDLLNAFYPDKALQDIDSRATKAIDNTTMDQWKNADFFGRVKMIPQIVSKMGIRYSTFDAIHANNKSSTGPICFQTYSDEARFISNIKSRQDAYKDDPRYINLFKAAERYSTKEHPLKIIIGEANSVELSTDANGNGQFKVEGVQGFTRFGRHSGESTIIVARDYETLKHELGHIAAKAIRSQYVENFFNSHPYLTRSKAGLQKYAEQKAADEYANHLESELKKAFAEAKSAYIRKSTWSFLGTFSLDYQDYYNAIAKGYGSDRLLNLEELWVELSSLYENDTYSDFIDLQTNASFYEAAKFLYANSSTFKKLVADMRTDAQAGAATTQFKEGVDTNYQYKYKQEFDQWSDETFDSLIAEENARAAAALGEGTPIDQSDMDTLVNEASADEEALLNSRGGNVSAEDTGRFNNLVDQASASEEETLNDLRNDSEDITNASEGSFDNLVDTENQSIEDALNAGAESSANQYPERRFKDAKDYYGSAYDKVVKPVAERHARNNSRSSFTHEDIYNKLYGNTPNARNNFRRLQKLNTNIDSLLKGKMSAQAFNGFIKNMMDEQGIGQIVNDDIQREFSELAKLEEKATGGDQRESDVINFQYAAADAVAHLCARMDMVEKTERARAKLDTLAKEHGKTNKNAIGNALDWYNRMQITGDNFWRMAGNWDAASRNQGYALAQEHNKAIATRISEEAKLKDYFSGIDKNSKQFRDFANGTTMSNVDFEGHKISLMEAVKFVKICDTMRAFANENRRPDWQRVAALGGFAFEGKDGKPVFVDIQGSKKNGGAERVQWVQDHYDAAMAEIQANKAASEYMKACEEMYWDASQTAEKVHSKVNGYERYMYGKGKYTDIHYASKDGKVDFSYKDRDAIDVHDTGIMQKRTRVNGGYVICNPMSRSIDAYISQISNYIAFEEFGQKLGVLNDSKSINGNYANTVGDAYGSQYSKWFDNYVKSMTLYRETDPTKFKDKALAKARQAMMSGALVGSVSVPIKQVSSFFDTIGMLDPMAVAKAFGKNPLGLKQKGINNYLYKSRGQSISDPDFAELFGKNGLFGKFSNNPVVKLAKSATNIMDEKAVSNVYMACVYDTEMNTLTADKLYKNGKNFNDGLTTEGQFYVDSKFEQVLLGTQPIFTPQARNELARTDNQWLRMLQTFRTQQTQNYNRMLQTWNEYQAADGSTKGEAFNKFAQTMGGQVLASASLAALTAIANGVLHKHRRYKDDDDELDEEKFGKKFLYGMVESMTGNALFAGDITKWAIDAYNKRTSGNWDWRYSSKEGQYFSLYNRGINVPILSSGAVGTALQVISSAINLYDDVQKNGWDDTNILSARYLAGNMTTALGVPANNVYNALNAGYQWYNDLAYNITGDKKYEHKYDDFITQYIKVDNNQQNRLVNAILSNNTDKIDDMFENMGQDKFANTVYYGALDRYKSGKIDRDEYIDMLVDYGGKTYKDAVKDVDKKINLIESGISQYNGIDGRDGRKAFYDQYSDNFKSKDAFKQFFTDVKDGKAEGKHHSYYTTWNGQQQEVTANQCSIIDRMNENMAAGNFDYNTAKLLWENYYGYSTYKSGAWQYVGKW